MAVDISTLDKMARGVIAAISRLEKSGLKENASVRLGQDYNDYREKVLEAKPELASVVGQPMGFDTDMGGTPVFCQGTNLDILSEYEKIVRLLPDDED